MSKPNADEDWRIFKIAKRDPLKHDADLEIVGTIAVEREGLYTEDIALARECLGDGERALLVPRR